MSYTQIYSWLKEQFSADKGEVQLPLSDMRIVSYPFTSAFDDAAVLNQELWSRSAIDRAIDENATFRYPVYVPSSRTRHSSAIVLLHGLNERNWAKYHPWAYTLAQRTQRPVIMFPISFHVNRSPQSWGNPREMMPLFQSRRAMGESMATFANAALSQRLADDPGRFFKSGYQTAMDVNNLMSQISSGEHPLFEANAKVDFFSYSIGSFLAQILFLANIKGLYSSSRLFMFCGGALFDQMNGVSKMIMDDGAFKMLRRYYLEGIRKEPFWNQVRSDAAHGNALAYAFKSMISLNNDRKFREESFELMRDRIMAIPLVKDKVIPAFGVMAALNPSGYGEVPVSPMDFPYDYTHENPFPVGVKSIAGAVDQLFATIFGKAAAFLM